MLRVILFLTAVHLVAASVHAATVIDATGRSVTVPDSTDRVLPAGPLEAVLLATIAPAKSVGSTGVLSDQVIAALPDTLAVHTRLPRLSAGQEIGALRPDLILDRGTVSSLYIELARDTQAQTGIPTVLFDGALPHIPEAARTVGALLHKERKAKPRQWHEWLKQF